MSLPFSLEPNFVKYGDWEIFDGLLIRGAGVKACVSLYKIISFPVISDWKSLSSDSSCVSGTPCWLTTSKGRTSTGPPRHEMILSISVSVSEEVEVDLVESLDRDGRVSTTRGFFETFFEAFPTGVFELEAWSFNLLRWCLFLLLHIYLYQISKWKKMSIKS